MLNEEEIRKAIALMKPNNQLFEVRLVSNSGNFVKAGYFKSADNVISELRLEQNIDDYSVYISLNHLKDALSSRTQFNQLMNIKGKMNTTSDDDIAGIEWILVDLDPKRPSGTSSSNEELDKCKKLANEIYDFMNKQGFEKPITAYSGNGVHLLYRVSLANTPNNINLVKGCLETLDMIFSNADVDIDRKVFNPARISKLYGTMATKGRDSEERPHRMAKIVNVAYEDAPIKATDIEYLKKLVSLQPKLDEPKKYNNYNPMDFDIENWMDKFSIRYKRSSYSDGTKYVLDCCPFNSQHKGKDACIFKGRNGQLGFLCFHNSCAGKTWKDVRILYEPDAYEKKQQEQEKRMYGNFNRDKQKSIVVEQGKPVFYTANDILNLPKVEETFIKTGITDVDKFMRGLKKSYVSVWSGLRASGKSSVLSQLVLQAVNDGNNVGVYSGELTERNFMRWMNLQACGKSKVEPSQWEGYYNTPAPIQKKIAEWLGDKFVLYNNEYGNDFVAVMEQFEKTIQENKLDLLILDNLMAFDIKGLSENKWESQTQFVLSLQKLAKKYNVHIAFVAHPRKAMGFLRLDDISGTGDLANAVDSAFIVHRVDNDFKRLSAQMFGWKDTNEIYEATNVIEIAKDRDGGQRDKFISLFYEMETKRLKNYISENTIYGWDKDNFDFGFSQVSIDDNPFD